MLFYSSVPACSRYRFLGVNLSDKLLVYVLGTQLLMSHSPASVVAGAIGVLVGLAYRSPALQLSHFQLPRFVNAFCATVFLPLLKSSDTRRTRPTRRPRNPAGRAVRSSARVRVRSRVCVW